MLTHGHHPNAELTSGLASGIVHSVSFGKCIMTYIHHWNIIQSILNALEFLCALPTYFFLFQHPGQSPIFIVFVALPWGCNCSQNHLILF